MCGIVACIIYPRENETNADNREHLARILFTAILEQTEIRGNDATGVVIHTADGDWTGLKGAIPSRAFIDLSMEDKNLKDFCAYTCRENNDPKGEPLPAQSTYMGFINEYWTNNPQKVRVVLGHCRKATKGNPDFLLNNHPLVVGPIVGVHNGGIRNYDEIMAKHKDDFSPKIGDVDSEVIFHLVNHFYPEEGTMTLGEMYQVTQCLEMHLGTRGGTAAIYFHEEHPGVVYAFRKGDRPLVFAYSKSLGLMFILSEEKFLKGGDALLKAMGKFDNTICDPDFIWKTSPDNEAYIIDSTREITVTPTMENLLSRRDIRGTHTAYEVKTTSTTTGSNYSGYSSGQWNNGRYEEPDELGKEAMKKVPLQGDRYMAPTWEKITIITPDSEREQPKPEVIEGEVVEGVEEPPEVDTAVNETASTSPTSSTVPPPKKTTLPKVISDESYIGGVGDYINPADWKDFVENLALIAETINDEEISAIKHEVIDLIKQAYGKGRGFHANDIKVLSEALRYIFIYRAKDIASIRNILELIESAIPSLTRAKLLKLMHFNNQDALEEEYLSCNTARATHA